MRTTRQKATIQGRIFNIQRYSIQDGPGIRTTVFFKGCPLECPWCSNPESQKIYPQLFYFESLCTRCRRCVAVCPNGATTAEDGNIKIDRRLCTSCGKCVEACLNNARAVMGKSMSVEEVLEIVKADSLFYRNSGGGVTASGGEAMMQPEFLLELFKNCHDSGLHTCLDTCGYVQWEMLEKILEYTDLVLYDIKHMDPVRHRELTGVGNELILQNAQKIVEKGVPVIVRLPLIPGCNDSIENLEALGKFVAELNVKIEVLPYHEMGIGKYRDLGQSYLLKETRPFEKEEVEARKAILESYGVEVEIVGSGDWDAPAADSEGLQCPVC